MVPIPGNWFYKKKKKKKETGHLSRKYASNQTTVSAQLLQAQPFGAGELTFRRFDLEVSGQLQNPVFPKLGANPWCKGTSKSVLGELTLLKSQKHQQVRV